MLFDDVVFTNGPRQYTDAVYLDTIISPYETNTSNSHAEREEITALGCPQYFFQIKADALEGFCSQSMFQGHAPGTKLLRVHQRFHR